MLKRTIAILAVLAIAASLLLTGCKEDKTETSPSAPASAAPSTDVSTDVSAEPSTVPSEEPLAITGTLKVAALKTAYGDTIWTDVAAAFNKIYPDVKVEIVYDAKLEELLSPQMQAGQYPDVVHLATGRPAGLTETVIKANGLEALTSVLDMTVPGETGTVKDKVIPGFIDTTSTNPYADGLTYLLPTHYSPCGLFYNEALFTANNWTVPTTWDEMWTLAEQAKAKNIALFCYPTAGYMDTFFNSLVYEFGGFDLFDKITHYAEGVYDTEGGKGTLDLIAKLATYTDKSVPTNANNDSYLKNQQLLLDNKALFMPNGTWVIGEMKDAPRAEGFKWGFCALPAVTAGGDRYSFAWFEQAWMPTQAANKDAAKAWLAFLYSDEAMAIMGKTGAVMSAKGASDSLEGDNKLFYSVFDNGAKVALGGWAATEPVDGVTTQAIWFDPINSLVSGDKTGADWTAGIKEANDKLRAALIK